MRKIEELVLMKKLKATLRRIKACDIHRPDRPLHHVKTCQSCEDIVVKRLTRTVQVYRFAK